MLPVAMPHVTPIKIALPATMLAMLLLSESGTLAGAAIFQN